MASLATAIDEAGPLQVRDQLFDFGRHGDKYNSGDVYLSTVRSTQTSAYSWTSGGKANPQAVNAILKQKLGI